MSSPCFVSVAARASLAASVCSSTIAWRLACATLASACVCSSSSCFAVSSPCFVSVAARASFIACCSTSTFACSAAYAVVAAPCVFSSSACASSSSMYATRRRHASRPLVIVRNLARESKRRTATRRPVAVVTAASLASIADSFTAAWRLSSH